MRDLKPQKIYVSDEDRRRDQRPDNEPEKQGLLAAFNEWACDKSQGYRREVYQDAADLELRIERALEQEIASDLRKAWSKTLSELQEDRVNLKVGYSDNVAYECIKAKKLANKVERLNKECPFN